MAKIEATFLFEIFLAKWYKMNSDPITKATDKNLAHRTELEIARQIVKSRKYTGGCNSKLKD